MTDRERKYREEQVMEAAMNGGGLGLLCLVGAFVVVILVHKPVVAAVLVALLAPVCVGGLIARYRAKKRLGL